MFLLKTLNGKENFVATILKKNNINTQRGNEKGFLLTDVKPSQEIIYELRGYVMGIIEIDEERAKVLINSPPKTDKEMLKPGTPVEVITGALQGFRGIARKITEEKVTVDINLFGQATALEVSRDEIKPISVEVF